MQASSAIFMSLHQLNTDDSSDDGGGDSIGAHCTNNTSAHCSSCSTDMAGSSRMDNNHIGKPDNQIRLLQRRPLSERLNAGRAQEVIQLPPMR